MKRTKLALTLVAVLLGVCSSIAMAADDTLTVRVYAGLGAYLDSNNGVVHIEMPPNAAGDNFSLRYLQRTPADFSVPPADSILLPNPFTLEFINGSEDLSTLKAPGNMVVKYNPPD